MEMSSLNTNKVGMQWDIDLQFFEQFLLMFWIWQLMTLFIMLHFDWSNFEFIFKQKNIDPFLSFDVKLNTADQRKTSLRCFGSSENRGSSTREGVKFVPFQMYLMRWRSKDCVSYQWSWFLVSWIAISFLKIRVTHIAQNTSDEFQFTL